MGMSTSLQRIVDIVTGVSWDACSDLLLFLRRLSTSAGSFPDRCPGPLPLDPVGGFLPQSPILFFMYSASRRSSRDLGGSAPVSRNRGAEWRVQDSRESRWKYGEEYLLPSRLGGLGSIMSSPSGVRREPQLETHFGVFLRPERFFLHLYANVLSSSNSVSCHFCGYKAKVWGKCPLSQHRTEPECSYLYHTICYVSFRCALRIWLIGVFDAGVHHNGVLLQKSMNYV